jgi:hypothetical protein
MLGSLYMVIFDENCKIASLRGKLLLDLILRKLKKQHNSFHE